MNFYRSEENYPVTKEKQQDKKGNNIGKISQYLRTVAISLNHKWFLFFYFSKDKVPLQWYSIMYSLLLTINNCHLSDN